MGIYISLKILPGQITRRQWRAVYKESLHLLHAHPLVLMRFGSEEVQGIRRLVYTRALETRLDDPAERHWQVSGDLSTRKTAESFEAYHDPAHYDIRNAVDGGRYPDILECRRVELFEEDDEESRPLARLLRRVFSAKTQGLPYHQAILAVGMLFEDRLPGAALVTGDFDPEQALQAKAWADFTLGAPISLPVVLDAARLFERLGKHHQGVGLIDAVSQLHDEIEPVLRQALEQLGRQTVLAWMAQTLSKASSARDAAQPIIAWLELTGDPEALLRMARPGDEGPGVSAKDLVQCLGHLGLLLPEAWPDALLSSLPLGGDAMVKLSLVMDDMRFPRHRLHRRIDGSCLQEILQRCFPDQAPALMEAAEQASIEAAKLLGTVKQAVQVQKEHGPRPAKTELIDTLLAAGSFESLSTELQQVLRVLVLNLSEMMEEAASHEELEPLMRGPVELHGALSRASWAQTIPLTELGWAWIDREQDTKLLRLLFGLMIRQGRDILSTQIREGLLENEQLCRGAFATLGDERLLEETRALRDRVRKQVGSS